MGVHSDTRNDRFSFHSISWPYSEVRDSVPLLAAVGHRFVDVVPAVIFTSAEVASVGTTELEYMDEHGTCSCRTIQMDEVPRAKAVKNTDGLVQVVKHHETDEIVGGPYGRSP